VIRFADPTSGVGGKLPVGFGVGFPVGWFLSGLGWTGVGDGVFKFGGAPCGAGEPGGVGFSPGPIGERPGAPAGFGPIRLGGTGFFPGTGRLDEALGGTFAFGSLVPGFNKLGGVFCPATGVATADPGAREDAGTWALFPIRAFTGSVGLRRSFGGGFCTAIVFLSFSAS
jgi:hypothetical protein